MADHHADIECSFDKQPVPAKKCRWLKLLKGMLLTAVIVFTVIMFIIVPESHPKWTNVAVRRGFPVYIALVNEMDFKNPIWTITSRGQFLDEADINRTHSNVLTFSIIQRTDGKETGRLNETWTILLPDYNGSTQVPQEKYPAIELTNQFESEGEGSFYSKERSFELEITTNETAAVALSLSASTFSELSKQSIIMASCVLVLLYILIIFEIIDRTLASMIGATAAIACMTLIGNRPTLAKVIMWLDIETLSLLFGMMIMVAVLSETGFFDYVAVAAFRLARGQVWPLVIILCVFTAGLSAFLDNVTTILLMTPITIKLCEIKNIDPKHVLIAQVLFSNIGGAATPIGDPPNVIIINSIVAKANGVDFTSFTLHVAPGAVLAALTGLLIFWWFYRDVTKFNFKESAESIVGRDMVMNFLREQVEDMHRETTEREELAGAMAQQVECGSSGSSSPSDENLKIEIDVWKKAHNSLGDTRDEKTVRKVLQTKVVALESLLRKKLKEKPPQNHQFHENLRSLEKKYKIKNKELLIKAGIVMGIVLVLFFLQSIPSLHLSLGWIAILGSVCLLVLADIDDTEAVFHKVEWPTLIFFACLFVVMEALTELLLLQSVGKMTQAAIAYFSSDWQLFMAINIVLWVSAIASSFIDNIPFATVMVKILEDISHSESLELPLAPLIYALAFGACLGGNGTLIGASANVVCAGVAETQGYKITFFDFFKIGFPVMLGSVVTANIYLIMCHNVFSWS